MPHPASTTTTGPAADLPTVPLATAPLPANGSLAYGHGRFFRVVLPTPPVLRVQLVEIPLSGRSTPPKVLSVDADKLRLAIARGVVTILPNLRAAPAAPTRPYPFEAARRAAGARRARLWKRRDIVELRRRGLLMTCAEYARRRARRAPAPQPFTTDDRDD